jgi:hypothetical protein
MAVLDFILNCVCLLLWLNWRSRGLTSLPAAPGIALIGTLKRAGRRRAERWPSSVALVAILVARAVLYAEVGSSTRWIPSLSFGPLALHFRTDNFVRMLLFSWLGFVAFLAIFYFSLFLITAVNRNVPNNEPWTALMRAHIGLFARLPAWVTLLAPFAGGFVFWIALGPMFEKFQLTVATKSFTALLRQASVIGLSTWMFWPYLIAGILMLYIVSSYVYLGNAPFWNFIGLSGRNLLRPLSPLPLRCGKADLTPLLALGLVIALAMYAPSMLGWLYAKITV